MILPDTKPDSLAVYTDWLIDNDQEELALEIREEPKINTWCYEENLRNHDVGTIYFATIEFNLSIDSEFQGVGLDFFADVGTSNWGRSVGNQQHDL